jgi:hypothetical protein
LRFERGGFGYHSWNEALYGLGGGWGVVEVTELKANGRNGSSVVRGDVGGEMIDEMLMDGVR